MSVRRNSFSVYLEMLPLLCALDMARNIILHNMKLIIILCARWILFPNLNYSDRRNPVESLAEHLIFADHIFFVLTIQGGSNYSLIFNANQ